MTSLENLNAARDLALNLRAHLLAAARQARPDSSGIWNLDPLAEDLQQANAKFATLKRSLDSFNYREYPTPFHLTFSDTIRLYFARAQAPSQEELVRFVNMDFKDLLERLGALRIEDESSLGTEEAALAGRWTGRRTPQEVAASVRRMVPVAIQALETLITDEERRLHNHPPEALQSDFLNDLRQFHAELGELLRAADKGDGLLDRLLTVARTATRIFRKDERLGITLRGLEVVGLSAVPTFAAVKALELTFGHPLDGSGEATLAAAIIAGTYLAREKGDSS
jgi:hypothetical protein